LEQPVYEPPEALPVNLSLAYERTRVAYERTLMAWTRTGTSLITFGFSVYKFFQLDTAGQTLKAPLVKTSIVGPREFGLVLISIGLLSLLLGTFEHSRDLRAMRREYPDMPASATRYIAVLMALLGVAAIVAVVYRF
jgi:putative membrane protein